MIIMIGDNVTTKNPMNELEFKGVNFNKQSVESKLEILDKIRIYYNMFPTKSFNDMLHDTGILTTIHDSATLSKIDEFIHGETIRRMQEALKDKFYDVTGLEFTNKIWENRLENLTQEDILIAFNQDAYIKVQMGVPVMNWIEYQSMLAGKDPPIEGQESINKSHPSTYSDFMLPNKMYETDKKPTVEDMMKKISLI